MQSTVSHRVNHETGEVTSIVKVGLVYPEEKPALERLAEKIAELSPVIEIKRLGHEIEVIFKAVPKKVEETKSSVSADNEPEK